MQLLTNENKNPEGDRQSLGRTAYMGLLLAFALILSYVETLIPFQTGMPGIKLGLANLAVVFCLYLFGAKEALLLTVMKAVISGAMFGSLFMAAYSLSGAVFSGAVMIGMKRTGWFHVPVVSAAGGVMHNMGQLLVAAFAVRIYGLVYYVPFLLAAGLVTGIIIGITAALALPYIQKIVRKGAA